MAHAKGLNHGGRWASLVPELVQDIADCVLSTAGGVEAYMDMRAVCSSWRSAIPKPSPFAAGADLRFRPQHWVMLDLQPKNDDACLFLHVLTGRFRCFHLPVLRDHILLGASDGLLVLGGRDDQPPRSARVLNPFTGDMLHFAAPLHKPFDEIWSTAVSRGSHWRLVFWGFGTVEWAAPSSDEFIEEDIGKRTTNMGTFQGNIYVVDLQRRIFKLVAPAEQYDAAVMLIAEVPLNVDVDSDEGEDNIGLSSHPVESLGELLLIRNRGRAVKVFRVDVERKSLKEVKSLGGCHALFLGDERCISVDASNLPSIDADCVYLFQSVGKTEYMCVYNLRDGTMETISSVNHPDRPFSLVQVLLRYCDFRNP